MRSSRYIQIPNFLSSVVWLQSYEPPHISENWNIVFDTNLRKRIGFRKKRLHIYIYISWSDLRCFLDPLGFLHFLKKMIKKVVHFFSPHRQEKFGWQKIIRMVSRHYQVVQKRFAMLPAIYFGIFRLSNDMVLAQTQEIYDI